MTTARFWKATGERVVKTFAQALLASITVGSAITDIDWATAASIAATAAAVALLTSILSSGVGDPESPSLTGEE
ncbi:holin [Nocardia sp. CA-290969]|uniref:holin n=1 Tax=Nocardia sp. CA-290969 TaxID=3239986 RepID=UPI003D8A167E